MDNIKRKKKHFELSTKLVKINYNITVYARFNINGPHYTTLSTVFV